MNLPDFLIIGAMKCATTTLYAQIANQPGIFMTTPKEPNFFSDDEVYAQGLDWYQALFKNARPDDIKGEASTHYTKRPTLPNTLSRMSAVLDAPKLIYMIRNPVDRAVSHYVHEWSKKTITDPIDSAFDYHPDLIDFGRFGMQVAPFAQAYGPRNILLTSLEQMTATPQDELTRISSFLDLKHPLQWQHDLGAQNVSAARVRPLPLQRMLVDNPVAELLRRTLIPKALRNRVRDARTIKTRPILGQAMRKKLEQIYIDDRKQLEDIFPNHPALRLCYPFAP